MRKIEVSVTAQNISSITFSVTKELQSVLLDSFCQWLIKLTEGEKLEEEISFQYGWVDIEGSISGTQLNLSAPDHKSIPTKWTNNLTAALESVVYHKFMPENYCLNSEIPNMNDTVLVSEKFYAFPMMMTRSDKSADNDSHSGWFIANSGSDVDISEEENLKFMSVYDAVMMAPHIFKYISMPAGTHVIFDSATPSILYKNKPIEPVANSTVATSEKLEMV